MHCDSIQEFAPSLQPSSSNLIRKSPFHLETSNVKSKCFMTFISVSWGHFPKSDSRFHCAPEAEIFSHRFVKNFETEQITSEFV